MTAQDLKNSILQLAVQGKLVSQNPTDEPASELLKRIADERIRRMDAGTFVVDKKHTAAPITADDIPYDLPENWKWARFADIVTFNAGKTPQRQNTGYWSNGEYPWVSIADMQSDYITTTTKESISKTAFDDCFSGKISPAGSMIMSFKLTIGKVSVLGMDAVHNEAIISIYPTAPVEDSRILQKWLFKIMPLVAATGNSKNAIKGKTLNATSISNLMIPVPPLAEQERIVVKIEELLPFVSEYDEAEKRLSALNAGFPDKLRKSILQQAVQGKLTERDSSDEPAIELLERIRAEKSKLITEGKIKKEKPLPPITEDDFLYDLPDTWVWVRLGDIVRYQGGYAYKSETYVKQSSNQVVRLGNVKNSSLLLSASPVYIPDYIAEETEEYRIEKDTILFTMTGTKGKRDYFYTCKTTADNTTGCKLYLNQRVGCLRPYSEIDLDWLIIVLQSEAILTQIFATATGNANQANIGSANTLKLMIPLPPLAEQQRIVTRVEELLAACNTLQHPKEKEG